VGHFCMAFAFRSLCASPHLDLLFDKIQSPKITLLASGEKSNGGRAHALFFARMLDGRLQCSSNFFQFFSASRGSVRRIGAECGV